MEDLTFESQSYYTNLIPINRCERFFFCMNSRRNNGWIRVKDFDCTFYLPPFTIAQITVKE